MLKESSEEPRITSLLARLARLEQQKKDTDENLLARVAHLEQQQLKKDTDEDNSAPENFPEIVFWVDRRRYGAWFIIFAVLVCVQLAQLKLGKYVSSDDSIREISDINGWVDEGLLEWRANRSDYASMDKLDIFEAMKKGDIGLTDEGFAICWPNIVLGSALFWCYLFNELNALLLVNKFPASAKDAPCYQIALAMIVLALQLNIAFWVGTVCANFAIASSLDTSKTIQAAIEAFFIMEIDETLIPVIWTVMRIFSAAKDKVDDDNAEDDQDDLTLYDLMKSKKLRWRVGSQIIFFLAIIYCLWTFAVTFRESLVFAESVPGNNVCTCMGCC